MNQMVKVQPPSPKPGTEDDPYRYGWRYVPRTAPSGQVIYDQVPLAWEDLLYPEEDDFVVQKPPHVRDMLYFKNFLDIKYHQKPDVVVLADCRIDWGVPGVRPMGPDIVTLFGVRVWHQAGTF